MPIEVRHEQLLNQWKGDCRESDIFFSDGKIAPEHFKGLLFLLSEPHIRDDRRHDQCRDLRAMVNRLDSNSDNLKFFRGLAMYATSILDVAPRYIELEESHSGNVIREVLQQVAVVNMKKTGGGAAACKRQVRRWLLDNPSNRVNFIVQVKDLINPNVIVPCGCIAREIMEDLSSEDSLIQGWYKERSPHKVAIRHPAYWRREQLEDIRRLLVRS